jgi:hypothetical protein
VIACVEREWKRSEPLEPVLTSIHDRMMLVRQIRRRLPPNPLRSMIECEGDIDGRSRFGYQMKVLGRRTVPFIKDCMASVRRLVRD